MPTQQDRVYFLVRTLSEKRPCAYVFLSQIDPLHRRAYVGVIVDPEFRGKGVGTAAVKFIMEYACQHLNIRKLYAHILVSNVASLRLFKSVGFQEEGLLKEHHYSYGKCHDVYILACRFEK